MIKIKQWLCAIFSHDYEVIEVKEFDSESMYKGYKIYGKYIIKCYKCRRCGDIKKTSDFIWK